MQLLGVLSTSHVANSFIGTGFREVWETAPVLVLFVLSAMSLEVLIALNLRYFVEVRKSIILKNKPVYSENCVTVQQRLMSQ